MSMQTMASTQNQQLFKFIHLVLAKFQPRLNIYFSHVNRRAAAIFEDCIYQIDRAGGTLFIRSPRV